MPDAVVDQRFMAAAIRLAYRHIGLTNENPSVGTVLVAQDRKTIIGHGVTAIGGRPHAEPQALVMAGSQAQGATAYVTLEPCSHFGKTPPCANALVKAGIKRVVIALLDPDDRVAGRGVSILQAAGIDVTTGVLAQSAYESLSAYMTKKLQQRPEVTLKLAISADNAIGIEKKGNVAISNAISHSISFGLRACHDAILVGVSTILVDDPFLTCRLPGLSARSPIRIVLDRNLRTPLNSNIVTTAGEMPTWIICDHDLPKNAAHAFRKRGVDIISLGTKHGQFLPQDILQLLFERNVASVLIEGGTRTADDFLNHDCVDKLSLFNCPINLGPDGVAAPDMKHYLSKFKQTSAATFGSDQYSEWRRDGKCSPV